MLESLWLRSQCRCWLNGISQWKSFLVKMFKGVGSIADSDAVRCVLNPSIGFPSTRFMVVSIFFLLPARGHNDRLQLMNRCASRCDVFFASSLRCVAWHINMARLIVRSQSTLRAKNFDKHPAPLCLSLNLTSGLHGTDITYSIKVNYSLKPNNEQYYSLHLN